MREGSEERIRASFAAIRDRADLVLLAGDLTTCGDPAEVAVLSDAGIVVLDRDSTCDLRIVLLHYNVSVPLIGRDFWIFELSGVRQAARPVH